jgi:hypothetical protein
MKKLLVVAASIVLAGSALAQDAIKQTRLTPDALTWKDNPAFPKGVQIATLVGDPTKSRGCNRLTHQVPGQLPNAAAHPPLFRGCDRNQRHHWEHSR